MQIDKMPASNAGAWQAHLDNERLEVIQTIARRRENFAVVWILLLSLVGLFSGIAGAGGNDAAPVLGGIGFLIGGAAGFAYYLKVRFEGEVAKYLCEKA